MKKLLGLVFLMMILVSATEFKSLEPTFMHSLDGTWELQSFYNYADDGQTISDTVPKAEGYRQVKIYHNGYIMWTRYVPDQPNGKFGYGTYRITQDRLIETIEYGDAGMMKALDTMRVFEFELQLEDNSYSQITLDEEGNRTFSENYKRID